jgi:tetratricopeptide (TPR) repeat protein
MLRTRSIALALAALVACGASAFAQQDQIRTPKALLSGTIEEMGKYEVTIKRPGDKVEKVPTNEIEFIRYGGEPPKLNLIRSAVEGGRYEDAIKDLDEMAGQNIERLEIKQDIEYYKALAMSRLALHGSGDLLAAGTAMLNFVTKNPGSYHFLDASEMVGDLLVANDKPDIAQQHYASLEQAPWSDVKMRGAVAKGRALQGAKKFAEALAVYDGAIALAGSETAPAVEAQKQAAIIGKAACLAETGKHAEGIQLLEDVINKADPERAELHAAAYNALGKCQRKAGNAKAALLAYLHTDVLYSTLPAAHAEALANLAELWKEVGNTDRALQAELVLLERYKGKK